MCPQLVVEGEIGYLTRRKFKQIGVVTTDAKPGMVCTWNGLYQSRNELWIASFDSKAMMKLCLNLQHLKAVVL
eukprot:scaffold1376_cov125-Cylindrotheca_fusiformis.AAC.3